MTQWSDDEKARAVVAYVASGNLAEGQRAVVREDGSIPGKNTIRRWAVAEGHNPDEIGEQAAGKTQAARIVAQRNWQDRRTDMIHELGEVADLAMHLTCAFLLDGSPRNAKDAATTCAILIDKAQVLSGDASAIVRTPWDAEAVKAIARREGEKVAPLHAVG